MLRVFHRPTAPCRSAVAARLARYSTEAPKVPLALVAQLRKETQVSITKAREALSHSNGDIPGALEWLRKDMESSGATKAAKVASRDTKEGVVAVSVLSQGAGLQAAGGIRAAMIELNCETDFVGRNDLFAKLAVDIAHTAAFISESSSSTPTFDGLSLDQLKESPLISHTDPGSTSTGTVSSAIRDTIVKVGENISLRRAAAIVEDAPPTPSRSTPSVNRLSSYVHGALHGISCGQVATLALLQLNSSKILELLRNPEFRDELTILERSLARQIVGFDTLSIHPDGTHDVPEQALYAQPFIMLPGSDGSLVGKALKEWSGSHGFTADDKGVEVTSFLKWKVGEMDS